MRTHLLTLAAACLLAAPGASAHGPATSFATEDSTAGWMSIGEPLARKLVADGNKIERDTVQDAIKDEGLARNYRQFFRARKIDLATTGRAAVFVRPASEPYYMPFYGAHIFRFWVVDAAGHVLLSSAADEVALLDSVHGGMRDLRVSQCRGGVCYDTTELFEHGQYRNGSCATRSIVTGATSAGCS